MDKLCPEGPCREAYSSAQGKRLRMRLSLSDNRGDNHS
jgi:hypothetical protein